MPKKVFDRLSRWGFVYWSPTLYRWTMACLRPKGRAAMFQRLAAEIGQRSVLDLCCGDGELIRWLTTARYVGIDQNPAFVRSIQARGHRVLEGDILTTEWPAAECLVMVEGLYHFVDSADRLMQRILAHPARVIIISESVEHMALRKEPWFVRFIQWGTRVDGRVFPGRFTDQTMRELLARYEFQTVERIGENIVGVLKRG